MPLDDTSRLRHMLDAALEAQTFMKDITQESLRADKKTTQAVIRSIEDIGEAAVNVSKELNAKASSGGSIRYKGEGLIRDIKVGSGGTVRRF